MKNILVIGIGRFGYHLIDQLNKAGDQILAVDASEERLEPVLGMVTSSLIGDATNETFVRSLGVENFDVCFVAIGDDFQASLETTSMLKECGAKYVVARAARSVQKKFLLANGADSVVFPEKQLAEWAAIRWCSGRVVDYLDYPGDFSIFEISQFLRSRCPRNGSARASLNLQSEKNSTSTFYRSREMAKSYWNSLPTSFSKKVTR